MCGLQGLEKSGGEGGFEPAIQLEKEGKEKLNNATVPNSDYHHVNRADGVNRRLSLPILPHRITCVIAMAASYRRAARLILQSSRRALTTYPGRAQQFECIALDETLSTCRSPKLYTYGSGFRRVGCPEEFPGTAGPIPAVACSAISRNPLLPASSASWCN
jgi:hypothetical protein